MMLLIILPIGYLIYLEINRRNSFGTKENQSGESPDALEIAKVRLAKGEISFSEFEKIKKNIRQE
jgi:putative membrane protein